MTDSILRSTKIKLGIVEDQTVFDDEVMSYINGAFGTLTQLGVGPLEGFAINDEAATWDEYFGLFVEPYSQALGSMIQTYVYLYARLIFDPPTTSFVLNALKEQLDEHVWRINVFRENMRYIA